MILNGFSVTLAMVFSARFVMAWAPHTLHPFSIHSSPPICGNTGAFTTVSTSLAAHYTPVDLVKRGPKKIILAFGKCRGMEHQSLYCAQLSIILK